MDQIVHTLTKAGLEHSSAVIYRILVEHGEQTVPQVLTYTSLSRASVYEALSELLSHDYVSYRKEGRIAYYKPEHPQQLFELFEQKKRELSLLEGEMNETIRSLTGTFNLSLNKPGVRFFDGVEGMKEVLRDSLLHNEEKRFYSLANLSDWSRGEMATFNKEWYAPKRNELGIKLIGLVTDHPASIDFLRNYKATDISEVLILEHKKFPFSGELMMYDNKVAFVSLNEDAPIGLIIEDPHIAKSLKSAFKFMWTLGKKHYEHPQPTWK